MTAAQWNRIIVALGTSVQELRRLIGWSQQQLADRAVVSQGMISRIENARCDDLPFHSIVVVLRTLGTAAVQLDLTVSPVTHALLVFIGTLAGPLTLVESPDPDLAAIVRLCLTMPPLQRMRFRRFVRSAAELLDDRGGDAVYAGDSMLTRTSRQTCPDDAPVEGALGRGVPEGCV